MLPPPPITAAQTVFKMCVCVLLGVGWVRFSLQHITVFVVVVVVVVVGPNCASLSPQRAPALSRQKGAPRQRPSSGVLRVAPQRAPCQPTHDGSGWASPWQQGKPKEGGTRSRELGGLGGREKRGGARGLVVVVGR